MACVRAVRAVRVAATQTGFNMHAWLSCARQLASDKLRLTRSSGEEAAKQNMVYSSLFVPRAATIRLMCSYCVPARGGDTGEEKTGVERAPPVGT